MKTNKNYLFKAGFLTVIFIVVSFACSFSPGTADVDATTQALQATQQAIDIQLTSVASGVTESPNNTVGQAGSLPTPTKEPEISLGEEYRSEDGGFSFRSIQNYSVEILTGGYTTIMAPNADPFFGPVIELSTEEYDLEGNVDEPFEFLKQIYSEGNQINFVNEREITVNGKTGKAVDMSGIVNDKEIGGRIVVLMVSSTRDFEMVGGATSDQWNDLSPLFDAVLASVAFFDVEDNEPLCGNGVCGDFENSGNCPQDCGSSSETDNVEPLCGNGVCGDFENPGNCPQDCGSSSETGSIEPLCGNGICGDFENPGNCPQDCK